MRKIVKIDPRLHVKKLEDLLDEPKVIRVMDFDEEALEEFEEDMDEACSTGQPIVPVVIDSYGGSVYSALGMIASIENCPLPVATIVTSKAMSAGACLFCFGTEGHRYMHPEAWLMIHEARGFIGGSVEEVKIEARQMDELNQRVYRRISKHLGHDADYLSRLIRENCHMDWYLTAKDARKHNIANVLKVPRFEIQVSLNVTFN